MPTSLNWNSSQLTHGWQRGVNAFFWGLGFKPEDFDKAQVGIGTPLLDGNLCNVHAHELALHLKQGCNDAGLIGFPFGVSSVSDNITQGLEGGGASLVSRNLIANGAEMVCTSHCYDAMIGVHHCDKNGPGFAMMLARTNMPGLLVSGGSILPGCHKGQAVTILDAYDSQAKANTGTMSHEESESIIRVACPGPGGCGIAASFNTWGIASEALGLMLPDSSSIPAVDEEKRAECRRVGEAVKLLLEKNIRPRDILTKAAFTNAMTAIAAAGGSTNGVIHLLAVAKEAGVDFTLRDMQAICRRTPVYANFAPRGKGTMVDLHKLGGTAMLLKHLLKAGLLDGSALTVTGKTLAENVANARTCQRTKTSSRPSVSRSKPMLTCRSALVTSHRTALSSKSATTSHRISKALPSASMTPSRFLMLRAKARSSPAMSSCCAIKAPSPLVCPKCSSLAPRSPCRSLMARSPSSVTPASPASHMAALACIARPKPLSAVPSASVKDGDEIEFDLLKGEITCHADLDSRPSGARALKHSRTYLADFAATVSQVDKGCVSGVAAL